MLYPAEKDCQDREERQVNFITHFCKAHNLNGTVFLRIFNFQKRRTMKSHKSKAFVEQVPNKEVLQQPLERKCPELLNCFY